MNLQALASPEGVTAMNQSMLRQQVNIAVLRKAIDSEAMVGQQLIQMMSQSTGLGTRIDTTV